MAVDISTIRISFIIVAFAGYLIGMVFYIFVKDNLKTFSFGFWTGAAAAVALAPLIISLAGGV